MKLTLQYIIMTATLMTVTGFWSMFYTEKSLSVTNIVNETKNSLKVASDAQAKLVTQTVSREIIETIINETVNRKVVETVVPMVSQASETKGNLAALAPLISSPTLQASLTSLAENPRAVEALQAVTEAVKEASEEGDDGKSLELITRLDSVEANIKKLEDFKIDELIAKVTELQSTTPSLTVLQENLDKLSIALTEAGNKLVADEVLRLSQKFTDQLNNEKAPLQVQISSSQSAIQNLQSSVSGLTNKDIDILEQISDIHSDIGGLTLNMSTIANQVVPIGGVLCVADWLGATIESNFVRADGQVLSEPNSLFDGMTMPNLNVAQLYLRGGATGGILQEASIPLLGTAVTSVTLDTTIDKARTDNDPLFDSYKNFIKTSSISFTTTQIKLGDATELRVKSLSCTFYIRIF